MAEQAPNSRRRSRIYLLLTATVDVGGVDHLARSDQIQRLGDYRWALELWAQYRGVDGLIFVENSGYNLDELRAIPQGGVHEMSVEFLSFDGQDFPRELGKGFGENLNIEHALENSELLTSDDTLILRVNGRNYVDNIQTFVDSLKQSTDILCDFKELLTWGDGRVLGGTVGFFKNYACPYAREVNDSTGYYYEHALARAIHRAMADGLVWRPFPEPPQVRGFAGTSNTEQTESRLLRIGRRLQHKVKLRMFRL